LATYDDKDFEGLRTAGRMAAETLDFITPYVAEGVSTHDLDRLVAENTRHQGGICATLNFHGYPKSCCISINDVICHGIPSKREFLANGDIVNIDITTLYNGYYGDTSRMFIVGEAPDKARELVSTAFEAMMRAIGACRPGQKFSEIGRAIEEVVKPHGFSIVRDFCGHGIGKVFHDEPNVLHYYDPRSEKLVMQKGQAFTIEPMINTGSWQSRMDKKNGWTARTADGGLSAQWEHTIGITDSGAEIFTKT
jgi:methionyl aminopeptidase